MSIGWYVHTTLLHRDFTETHLVYGPFFPPRKAWEYIQGQGGIYFAYSIVKFHIKKPHEKLT